MSPTGKAAKTVRVLDAVPSPSGQPARYRRHVNVTSAVPQEALLSCLHRSHQLLPGSNAVSVPSPRKMDSTNGTHTPIISRGSNEWHKRGGQNCNDGKDDVSLCVDGGSKVLLGPCNACDSCGSCTSDGFFVCGHLSRASIAQSRQCGTARSNQMSDEPCGLGAAWWTRDESRRSVHSCQRSWMQGIMYDRTDLPQSPDRTRWRARLE